jgi:hypothetical protein
VSNQRDYDIPKRAFGRRIEKIEISTANNVAWEVKRISNHDRTYFITSSQSTRPFYMTIKRNKIQLYPKPTGDLNIEIHFNRRPEPLVLPQGRVTQFGTDGDGKDFVLVDAIGSQLNLTPTVELDTFVNVVDFITGEVKATLQLADLDPTLKKVKFRTATTRTRVLLQDVDTALPATIQDDDYICLVRGTCVSEIDEAYIDFVLQYAVVAIRRRFGEPVQDELIELNDQRKEIEKMWSGRESTTRVRKSSKHWTVSYGGNLRRLLS